MVGGSASPQGRGAYVKKNKMAGSWRRPPIAWGICMEKYVNHQFWPNFFRMKRQANDYIITMAQARTDLARNEIVKKFLEKRECTHLMFLDSDQLFNPETVPMLMATKKQVVGCLYFHRQAPYQPHMYRWDTKTTTPAGEPICVAITDWEEGSLVQCDAIGTGGLLIERGIFDVIKPPWFEYGGQWDSEDITFCRKLTKAGVPVFCDTSCESAHIGEVLIGRNQFRMHKLIAEGKLNESLLKGVL